MYLLILESIGTSELILIGIVALIVFGPRKLPQMAKTLGKMLAEFRSATNEFKTTWQKEASVDEDGYQIKNIFEIEETEKIIHVEKKEIDLEFFKPEIREVEAAEIKKRFEVEANKTELPKIDKNETGKRDWL